MLRLFGKTTGKITKLALAIAVLTIGMSALAQQSGTYRVKPTPEDKPKKPAPIGKVGSGTSTASASNAKDLNAVEHQTAKSTPAKSGGKKQTALRPVKDKPNPPINFGGSGGKTQQGHQVSDPSKGRLRQKHSHQ
jgi:hypothetical protein